MSIPQKTTGRGKEPRKQADKNTRSPDASFPHVTSTVKMRAIVHELQTVRSSSSYTRSLLEASLDPLVTISADGKITDVNAASVNVTGVPRDKLIGTDFSAYFTEPEVAREGYLQVFSQGTVVNYPLAIRHVSGNITEVLYNASVYRDELGVVQGVFAAARDVTDRNRAEEALTRAHAELEMRVAERTAALECAHEQMKKVSFELVRAEERERERIAAELHDQVGQSLLLAKMKLDALTDKRHSEAIQSQLLEATSLLESSINDIRTLTFRMRPPMLDTAGIETALKWLCSSISGDYSLQVDFVSDCPQLSLSPELRYSLYQAVRELLINVAKHAATDKAQLFLTAGKDTIIAKVADHGVGFDSSDDSLQHINRGSYGLYNIKQRIEQMGGAWSIESAPGMGTTITLTLPLTP
jgi:PAS domain S-box-containing protein